LTFLELNDTLILDGYRIKDDPYDTLTIISDSSGHVAIKHCIGDKCNWKTYTYGQYVISESDIIYEDIKVGINSWKFVSFILTGEKSGSIPNHLVESLENSILAFNMYTFQYELLNRDKLIKQYGPFETVEYHGCKFPFIVRLKLDDRYVLVPHFKIRPVFNVKHEWLMIDCSKDLPIENEFTNLALTLIRTPIKTEEK